MTSDVDPVGSVFNWVRGSGSRGIKLREKQSLTTKVLAVLARLAHSSSKLFMKRYAYTKVVGKNSGEEGCTNSRMIITNQDFLTWKDCSRIPVINIRLWLSTYLPPYLPLF